MENDIKIPLTEPSTSQEAASPSNNQVNDQQTTNQAKTAKNYKRPEKKKKWTVPEKTALLTALERFGPSDINQICGMIPTKTPAAVQQLIDRFMLKTKYGVNTLENTLDDWLSSGYFDEDENTMVPQALLFMHLFEDHPPPEETAGCDVKEIYKFLYYCSLGQTPDQLSDMTAIMFKELMMMTDREIWPWKEREILEFICMNVGKKKPAKDYSRQVHVESCEDSEDE